MNKSITSILLVLIMFFTFWGMSIGCERADAYTTKYGTVNTAAGLNIREGAGTEYTLIGAIANETEITIVGEKKDSQGNLWYQIVCANGVTGYAMGKYLDISDKINNDNSKAQTATDTRPSNCTYADVLLKVGELSGVNPYVLASMIVQEQGANGIGGCISGKVSGYEGYYNYFNVGAYAANGMTAVQRGVWYASQDGSYGRPWNTRYKSILGGAEYYYKAYVSKNQNTLYLKKWDVMNGESQLGDYQYMTNIMGAYSESIKLRTAYLTNGSLDTSSNFVFYIPVYKDMPEKASPRPAAKSSQDPADEPAEVISPDQLTDGSVEDGAVIDSPVVDEQPTVFYDAYEESLYTQGFPLSYIPYLVKLHEQYPNWIFKPAITNLSWQTVMNKERKLGTSLIASHYTDEWKAQRSPAYNEETGKYKSYDSGGWNAASDEAIAYYLDPRNFLTDVYIFQFLDQSFDASSQNLEGMKKVLSNTFMSGDFPEYVEAFGDENIDDEYVDNSEAEAVAALDKKNQKIIDGIEDTTIKLSSSIAKKGIKVTWTKSPGYKVDYYQVYRSVKKSSGYGKTAFYTTSDGNKLGYTNTKDLKKGTRYYFKVRGVRIITDYYGNETKIYTQYSNKANRTWK